MASNKSIGHILSSYFQGHYNLSFDLLMNALIINYDIPQRTQSLLAKILPVILGADLQDSKTVNISVQDLIRLTDYISIPQLLIMIENGAHL